ncbi:SusC/RagA family TonB-linked outer membrane protein [Flavobacterium quisquiliarum]|uniref:SusC/RagA family TonB-linked outer membrane protein n=1 Tax=Flavobacterium quisquiliarum TaxID=1834436 RepID=A0ABV8W2W7_9FLAO|nr:TonB-dependent receptor [Flavobacterium quisquiliarum]
MKKNLSKNHFGMVKKVRNKAALLSAVVLLFDFSANANTNSNSSTLTRFDFSRNSKNHNHFSFDLLPSFQNEITVKGKVVDEKGLGIPGVSIVLKGTKKATMTDIDGSFVFEKVPSEGTLTFSFIGMETQHIAVGGRSSFNVTMKDSSTNLDEVVVIGYGTAKRKDLTGSVASVNMKDLKDIPATSALQAIAGRLAGVNVTITEGSPDAQINVRVRGGSSITQDNSPLYIVDGFQVNSINDIPPGDIETIDVLKDASSTAIYGSQGANGVVLITTKSGKKGKTEITVNAYTGLKKTYNLTDVLSPYEYVYFQKELDPGSNVAGTSFYSAYGLWEDRDIYKSKKGFDWQEQLYGNTGVQTHTDMGLTGGDAKLQYKVNYTHDQEDFIMVNSAYKRDYVSFKLNKELSSKFRFDFNSRFSNTIITGPSVSNGGKLKDGIKYAPVRSLTYLDPALALGGTDNISSAEALSSLNDPIYNITNEYKEQNNLNLTMNGGLTWKPIKGLSIVTQGSYAVNRNYTDNIWLRNTGEASANGGQPVAKRQDVKGADWSIQNTLSYDRSFNKTVHKFNVLLGQEARSSQVNETLIQSKFFPSDFGANDVLAMWNYGTPLPTYTTIGEPTRTSSYFGRINYTLHDKYIFSFTSRFDGKNVFAPDNRWGYFPGAAFAWRMSDEKFMEKTKSWLSDAKFRLSYGEVGNARVGSYWRQDYSFETAANRLIYVSEVGQSSLKPSNTLKNENLTWETTVSTNLGLDLGFFNQRLTINIDAYKIDTNDLILAVALPSNSGYVSQYQNIGSTSNKGIEFTVNGNIVETSQFRLSANFNIAFNKNVVKSLDGSNEMIAASNWAPNVGRDDYRVRVGQPVGLMYGYVSDGMYTFDDFNFDTVQKKWILKDGVADASKVITTSGNYFGPGHMKLKKLSGTGNVINPDEDRKVIGRAQPKHTGGFALSGGFKGLDFSALFNWSYGNDIYNANKIDNSTFSGSKRYNNANALMSLDNRFTTIDPVTGNNIMFGNDANPQLLQEINQGASIWHPLSNSTIITDWAIEDGSFLRLGNLTIGYTLPETIAKGKFIQKVRCYVSGNNLKVWTRYSGQDPEVSTNSSPLTPGLDWSAYPKARTLLFGANITF